MGSKSSSNESLEWDWDNVTGTELVDIRDGVQLFSTGDLSNGVT